MEDLNKEIIKVFGNKLRVRISGICIHENKILLVKHHSLGPKGILWSPPGGGMIFGESAPESLVREFKEETGLNIEVIKFLFVHEYLELPLHALELFFEVKITGGKLIKGIDPEIGLDKQIIQEVVFKEFNFIHKNDPELFHSVLVSAKKPEDLLKISGYWQKEKM